MLRAQLFPFPPLRRQRVRLENRQCHQRGNQPHQNVIADFDLPERLETQLLSRPPPTGQPHPAAPAEQTDLAQFVISEIGPQPGPEFSPQLFQAFPCTLAGGIIGHTDKR